MNLLLTSVDTDTYTVALATEGAVESHGQVLLHPGDWHEGIAYETWTRFLGRRVHVSVLEAAARLASAASDSDRSPTTASDIPPDVQDFNRCPACGVFLVASTLQIPSPSLALRLLDGAMSGDTVPLRLNAEGVIYNLLWTGQTLPARWCPDCRVVLFRVGAT